MIAVTAAAWWPCASPDIHATTQAAVQTRPTPAITRLRRRCSTRRSTTNWASTMTAVFAARAMPRVAGEILVTCTANADSPDSNWP